MSEPLTISRKKPESKSQQYDFLREEGLKHIQNLAGKIWTDYNIHDPGVTILEALCYAITDLGYRASYSIEDILANAPGDAANDIKNFYTARQILPNAPVTLNDYRKLLIDVDVEDSASKNCKHVGIKNAWLEKAKENEIPVYVHAKESKLSYEPDPLFVPAPGNPVQKPLEPGILYDILLEFEKCDAFGDLNENSLSKTLTIDEFTDDPNLEGMAIKITVEFPRWDNATTNWQDTVSIKSDVRNVTLRFSNVPNTYSFSCELVNNLVKLEGKITSSSDVVDVPGIAKLEQQINDFIYFDSDSLLAFYLQKIGKIAEIIDKVKARLHANRNLCEDFYRLSALKVEKIAVCADIELEHEADVEEVLANIYHEIGKFLSPTVHFYTLDEMLDKCKILHELPVAEIDKTNGFFRVKSYLEDVLKEKDIVTVKGSRSNDGDYTVKKIVADKDDQTTKIYVEEDITSDLLTEGELLSYYTTDQEKCLTVDEIFEGPALEHGFIDDEELEKADRKKNIHVSDLIQIIMDVPGVIAVKTIQIANIPQDNEDGAIPSKSVKWCLDLAFEQNYVPRLSMADSKITFYKDRIPFQAAASVVEERVNELENLERPAKLFNPKLDFDVPEGKYRNPEDYQSIQHEFPLVYGIGEEGLPTLGNNKQLNDIREAKALQLKGFLMHFDQLLANYLSQLAHVKDLFSMNAEKDEFGNYLIGRTYYTQPLFDIVPNAEKLYVDKSGHVVALNEIAESNTTFLERKNKFLDHLIGRFAENFTDYAMLTFRLSGETRGKEELIEDKLAFLNSYPELSAGRGKGFNHQSRCNLWHVENISGFRQRVSFITGIAETSADELRFSPRFEIIPSGIGFEFQVSNTVPEVLLKSPDIFESEKDAALAVEKLIINGISKEKYEALTDDGTNFYFRLKCDEDEILAVSEKNDYPDDVPGGLLDSHISELVQIFEKEFYGNPESNRNNLACAVLNYIRYNIETNMIANPPVATVNMEFFSEPLKFNPADMIFTAAYVVEGEDKKEAGINSVNTGLNEITVEGNIASELAAGDVVVIDGSADNDGNYTVVSAGYVSGETKIVVSESPASDSTPRGKVLYNTVTEAQLRKKAENKVPEILWQLIKNAATQGKYYFTDEDGPYKFRILNNAGAEFAVSVESDFNAPLADEIANLGSGKVNISGSSGNDGEYTVVSAIADGPDVTVNVAENLPDSVADGKLSFTESFDYEIDLNNNTFKVADNLTGKLFAGDPVEITGSKSNDGSYTVFAIDFSGGKTKIVVEEPIPSGEITEMQGDTKVNIAGKLTYSKSFDIDKVGTNSITFKGGYDVRTVELLIDFITEKFFNREGFHVVEHVLLRPKVKGDHFVALNAGTLNEGLAAPGKLFFRKTVPLFSSSETGKWFKVEGDFSADLDGSDATDLSGEIVIEGTGMNDGTYSVQGVSYNAAQNRTEIRTKEPVPAKIPNSLITGTLSFLKGTDIVSVSASPSSVIINNAEVLNLAPGETVEIRGSSDGQNNGRFLIKKVVDNGASQEVELSHVEQPVEDRLLSIILDENKCDDCQIKDPYTCIAHIVLPHWQGRFDNMEFRRFFERQLRLELPAHVFPVICWVSCEQMTEFEQKYKAWLVENARAEKDEGLLSARLNDLIDVLERLRNVYPTGTLHDCEEDETLENAIILDNTVLGNA